MGRASVEPGDLVAEKYRVEHVIGKGAMGLVLAAQDVKLGKRVALKCLLPHAWGNAAAVARFEREARASVALESEHVCRVLDVGRMPDGAPFIAMELLEGMDLAHELHRRGGRLPIAEAVGYVVEACDAIAEAHARGIIHRDLKPSNLFLAKRAHKDPIIKVLDFGISKPTAVGQVPSALTGTADLLGSPLYMSPEQLRTPKDVDARSDVWSLAATLYELVCGKTPFDGPTIADLASNIINAPPPDLRPRVPNLPPGFHEVIARALAKRREARYQTVADFARALAPYAPASKTVPLAAVMQAPASSTKMMTTPITPVAPHTPREANRTLPLPPGSAPALPPAARSTPVTPAPSSEPSIATRAAAQTASPLPVQSLSGPIGLIGSLVAAIVIAVVVFATRSKETKVDPDASIVAIASAAASGSAEPEIASDASTASMPAASASASPPSPLQEEEDASEEVAPPTPVPPPTVVRPPGSVSTGTPDARVWESAGY